MERNNTIALEDLKLIHLNSAKVFSLVENLIPTTKAMTSSQIRGAAEKRICLMETYFHSPDYKRMSQNGYKFLAAVSEYTTQKKEIDNESIESNPIMSRAYFLLKNIA